MTIVSTSTEAAAPRTRRCACGCGLIVGPLERWASHACYLADNGREDTRDEN